MGAWRINVSDKKVTWYSDMLTDEQIRKFQELYQKQYGYDISSEEAQCKGEKLIQLFRLAYVSNRSKNIDSIPQGGML